MAIAKNSFIVWSHPALKDKCLTTFFSNSLWSRSAYLIEAIRAVGHPPQIPSAGATAARGPVMRTESPIQFLLQASRISRSELWGNSMATIERLRPWV